ARHGAGPRLPGGVRLAVPDPGRRPRTFSGLLQAVSAVHPGGRARRRCHPRRRRFPRVHQLLRGSELVGDLAHPGLAPEAAVAACALTSAFLPPRRTSAPASTRWAWRWLSTTKSSPKRGRESRCGSRARALTVCRVTPVTSSPVASGSRSRPPGALSRG